jgi:hypothetical protein
MAYVVQWSASDDSMPGKSGQLTNGMLFVALLLPFPACQAPCLCPVGEITLSFGTNRCHAIGILVTVMAIIAFAVVVVMATPGSVLCLRRHIGLYAQGFGEMSFGCTNWSTIGLLL